MCIVALTKKNNMEKIDEMIRSLNSKLSKKIVFQGEYPKIEVIPTGIAHLDYILGTGGIPRGRITDIYGLESVGKSTVCYSLIAEAQKKGLTCAVVESEYAFIPEYAEKYGVDTKSLIMVKPDCLEEAGDVISELIQNDIGLIIVDSVSGLVPRALAEADHGKSPMALQARGMSQMLIKILAPLHKHNTALVTINQLRINIMAMHPGDKYTTTGGRALKFYSSVRIEMKRRKAIMLAGTSTNKLLGYVVNFAIKKNKMARPSLSCEVEYRFGKGFDKDGDLAQIALEAGILEQAGAWYVMGEQKWQGKEKTNEAIKATPALRKKILKIIYPSLH